MNPKEKKVNPVVYEYLKANGHRGQENAIKMRALGIRMGMTDRAVRGQVWKERVNGKPICFSLKPPAGYYLPAGMEDIKGTYKILRKRAVNEWQVIAPFRRLLREPPQDILISENDETAGTEDGKEKK